MYKKQTIEKTLAVIFLISVEDLVGSAIFADSDPVLFFSLDPHHRIYVGSGSRFFA